MQIDLVLFYVLGALAVVAAIAFLGMIRSTFAGVLALLISLLSLAGVLVLLDAHFVAAFLVIAATSLCAAMLLLLIQLFDRPESSLGPPNPGKLVAKGVGAGAALWLGLIWLRELPRWVPDEVVPLQGYGGVREIGRALYSDYVVPLELAGVLLLAALVAGMILALRESD